MAGVLTRCIYCGEDFTVAFEDARVMPGDPATCLAFCPTCQHWTARMVPDETLLILLDAGVPVDWSDPT